MFKNLFLENKLLCLNTHFQKRQGQTWTYNAPNSSTSQIDYVIINKNWKHRKYTGLIEKQDIRTSMLYRDI